ncbi:cation:dicarboxylate symporter family transporter [Clostridium rectalis]|uniref:cation:dicarboxylate symporter family transporter n=1 Tax=Clostridium rectalis TaxID=2040295 RepID=UPI00242D788E|nr:cation:dicarboxylase symporter family transporter [Clostridium rectalis]
MSMIIGIKMCSLPYLNMEIIELIGKMYINLIKMLVIPLVVSTLISSITSIEEPENLS